MNKEESITNDQLRITNTRETRNFKLGIRDSKIPELRFHEFETNL
jgi:hypothetical protein